MSYNTDIIRNLLSNWILKNPVKYCDVTVDSVNEDEKTCLVSSCDGSHSIDSLEVRYMPEVSDGTEDVPEVGSTVVVVFTELTQPVIISTSWLTRKTLIVGNQSFEMKDGLQKFNEGEFGGIPIVKDPDDSNAGLLKRINLLEDIINDLQSKFAAWVVVPNDGGLALKTILTSTPPVWNVPNLTSTTESQISNPSITHGA